MTLAGYQAIGNSCAATSTASYSSTMPADGGAKCIKVAGVTIPKQQKARIRINLEFRPQGTDNWNANATLYFSAGFPFKTATTLTFRGATQTSIDAAGLVGTNLLPSGVQYAVQVCNGPTTRGIRTTDSKLKNQEFEQVDFSDLP